jgi:hypothetical protein
MSEIDRAEFTQAINAYFIPTGLFVACLMGAAGIFLIREGYGLGWAFLVGSAAIMVWAFTAFVKFQNKLRAKGMIVNEPETEDDDKCCFHE